MEPSTIDRKFTSKTVGVIGVSVKEGQKKTGVEKAPGVFRNCGLIPLFSQLGLETTDYGDIKRDALEEMITSENNSTTEYKYSLQNDVVLGCMNKVLSEMVHASATKKENVVILGGDHGLATGSIHGMKKAYPDLKVIWIDAHGDCNTPEISPSGNYHGMPVAHLLGWIQKGEVKGFDWFEPCLKAEDIVYIGLRDIDPKERELIRKANIKVFTPYDIEILGGMGKVMDETLAYLKCDKDDKTPIHISFDVDGCDPSFMTATGTRARCGLTERESHTLLRRVAQTGNLVSVDMVEVNPELEADPEAVREVLHGDMPTLVGPPTSVYACEFIFSALGNIWL